MGVLDDLMPMPVSVVPGDGAFALNALALSQEPSVSPRMLAAAHRLAARAEKRFGASLAVSLEASPATLEISIATPGSSIPMPNMDESYTLHIDVKGIRLLAAEEVGALRGLQTLLQLLRPGEGGWVLPFVNIEDAPRFSWRGVLLDTSRHFMQVEHVMRLLDGMELAKLNVLHFHLANDQGFRMECETFPKLHELGSEGAYYTRQEMRGLIEAAAERGIRIVPEFCLPGHSVSWQVAYPELSAADPAPREIGEMREMFSVPIDPTREETYGFIDRFVAEMAALFPDPYFHTGGDEVNPGPWKDNPRISDFMEEKGFARARDLQAYFTGRYAAIVAAHGKTAVGWEEVLHSDVDENVILHLWKDGIYPLALSRHPILVSWNYYLDLQQPARWLYGRDPHDFQLTSGGAASDLNVLGAEMANWAETIHGGNLDLRTWPRGAAIAERFWSARDYCDGQGDATLYERLSSMSKLLTAAGLRHERHVRRAMGELYGADGEGAFGDFAALIEPAAYPFLRRRRLLLERALPRIFRPSATERYSDVRRFVDHLAAESEEGRIFSKDVRAFIETGDDALAATLTERLARWEALGAEVSRLAARNDAMCRDGVRRVAKGLSQVARIGSVALCAVRDGGTLSPLRGWWLKRRLRAYAHEVFYLDKAVARRIMRDLRKPDAINRHNIAIFAGVSHLLEQACQEEA